MPRRRQSSSSIRVIAIAACLALTCLSTLTAWAMDPGEAKIKSGFLYNFAKYTEWPGPAAERVACVAPKALSEEALAGIDRLPLQNAILIVRNVSTPDDIDGCHILLIGRAQRPNANQWLSRAARSPILTVADLILPDRPHSIVHLYMEGRRMRYDLHLGLARQAGLKLHTRLINLADTLYSEQESQ